MSDRSPADKDNPPDSSQADVGAGLAGRGKVGVRREGAERRGHERCKVEGFARGKNASFARLKKLTNTNNSHLQELFHPPARPKEKISGVYPMET